MGERGLKTKEGKIRLRRVKGLQVNMCGGSRELE